MTRTASCSGGCGAMVPEGDGIQFKGHPVTPMCRSCVSKMLADAVGKDAEMQAVRHGDGRPARVAALMDEWSKTFKAKNTDYGSSYILAAQTIRLWFPEGVQLDSELKQVFFGLLVRMLDKLIRASNLVLCGTEEKVKDEKAYQTLGDLGVYGFMAAEAVRGE